jgi:glutaredoxin
MISSTTPYKLAEVIRDTWPGLYRKSTISYDTYSINTQKNSEDNMKFTVYSKDGCPYCTKVQQVLELAQLQHVVYKLNTDFSREEFYAEFGEGSTFPQVIVNDKHLGGCTDTVQYLKEQNLV